MISSRLRLAGIIELAVQLTHFLRQHQESTSEKGDSVRDKLKTIAQAMAISMSLLTAAPVTARGADLRLVEAVRNQNQQQVRTLLNQNADVNARASDGSTALLWAAHWSDLETADRLIRAGADANAANDFRMTPLSEACTNGSAALVDLLLKAGANPNTPVGTGVPQIGRAHV